MGPGSQLGRAVMSQERAGKQLRPVWRSTLERKANRWVVRMLVVSLYSKRATSRRVLKGVRKLLPAQPGFAGAHYSLRPVCHLQLGEDAGDVVAHRLGAHVQLPRYLGIGATSGDEI